MLVSGDVKRYIQGQVTLNGDTEVTFDVPTLEADSVVVLSLNTVGGTPAGAPYVSTKNVSAKQIGIKGVSGDTSVVDVVVFA